MDEGTPLGGLEPEDNAEPSHGFHAVLPSLRGRGRLAHRPGIRLPEDEGLPRSKQPSQLRRLAGPAGGGSGQGLATLGAVPAVPATLPRPRGPAPRPPGGRPGASAAARRPREAQAHAPLGGAIRHRQSSEARNIQADQQSRRDLRQRLEHQTATSLLPLRCFQVVHIPRTYAKFSRQGRVGLASAKPDPPSGAKRGETPSASNFSSKKDLFLAGFLSCYLTTSESGSWKRRGTRKQPRLTEPRDSYASGIRIPHSSPSAISNLRSDKATPWTERVITFGSSPAEAVLQAFSTKSGTGPHGRVKVRVSGKADRAEGFPRLWDTDTSLVPSARSNSRSHKHPYYRQKVQMLETRGKKTQLRKHGEGVFSGLGGRRG